MLENIKEDNWAIGIGVNITNSPVIEDSPYRATSLKENGVTTDRIEFLKKFLIQFAKDLEIYQQNGFSEIKKQWLAKAYKLGQELIIKNEHLEKKGLFLTLDDNGYLILKTKVGEEKIIAGDLF